MSPVLIHMGPFELRWYGLMIATAFLTGIWLAKKEAHRNGIEVALIEQFSLWVILFSIVGARVYYIIFSDPGLFWRDPLAALAIWNGGLAIHGGILGGLVAGIFYTRKHHISFWKLADTLAPSLILGQAIGRIGCFFNGDAHGLPTTLPWGLIYSSKSPAGQMFPGQPLHPTQLYELGLNLIIFTVLWKNRKKFKARGSLFLLYVVLYSIGRFVVEIFRADKLTYMGDLSTAQTISIFGILVAAGFAVFRNKQRKSVHHQ